MTLAAGRRLGPYEIVAPLGGGGMGDVYRARDVRLDRSVAVKILPAELSGDAHYCQRFEREARAASALSHPHIAHVYDVLRRRYDRPRSIWKAEDIASDSWSQARRV